VAYFNEEEEEEENALSVCGFLSEVFIAFTDKDFMCLFSFLSSLTTDA
jgi:hypothetical protein